jgi:CheY-like chemotaxis protein
MPGRDGYWLIRELRARGGGRGGNIPAVAVTAVSEHGPKQALAAGFQAHLRKPVDPWELCRVVETLARQRQES